jgi:hypothetical protein
MTWAVEDRDKGDIVAFIYIIYEYVSLKSSKKKQ